MLIALVMAFSVSSASAFCFPSKAGGTRTKLQFGPHGNFQHSNRELIDVPINPDQPGAVPEPTTILLLAGGLGATLWKRARMKV